MKSTKDQKDKRESARIAGECWKSAKKRLAEKRKAKSSGMDKLIANLPI